MAATISQHSLPGPAEPEDANDEERPSQHSAVQTLLGGWVSMPSRNEHSVMPLDDDVEDGAESRSDADANKNETALASVEASELLPDDREDGELKGARRRGQRQFSPKLRAKSQRRVAARRTRA